MLERTILEGTFEEIAYWVGGLESRVNGFGEVL